MSKLIDLAGLSRFLNNLRKENEPFYVHASIGAEMAINNYDCNFSDIMKAWEKGRPIYVCDSYNSEYMIIGLYRLGDTGFYFYANGEVKILVNNGT